MEHSSHRSPWSNPIAFALSSKDSGTMCKCAWAVPQLVIDSASTEPCSKITARPYVRSTTSTARSTNCQKEFLLQYVDRLKPCCFGATSDQPGTKAPTEDRTSVGKGKRV